MSKELEALDRLYDISYDDMHSCMITETHYKELELLKQALTPPTEQEVCDALSEWFVDERKIRYEQKAFIINNPQHVLCDVSSFNDNVYYIRYPLPPHLITMIGRFYEAQNETD